MQPNELKPNMRLQMSVGIPPTLLKFHVTKSGKGLICDTEPWRPKRVGLTKITENKELLIEDMEVCDE